jgi:hypothetical protein
VTECTEGSRGVPLPPRPRQRRLLGGDRVRRPLRWAGLLAAGFSAMWACSGAGAGSSTPPAAETSTTALRGLLTADVATFKGTLQKGGVPYTVDVTADRKGNSHATLAFGDASVEVIGIGSNVYRKGNVAYWSKQETDARVQRAFASTWVKIGGGGDQDVLRAVVDRDLESDLERHFKPAHETSASLSGSAARKLSGNQGSLYVTTSTPARALSFVSSAAYVSPAGLTSIRSTFTYPTKLDLTAPRGYLNPDDQSTWPAEFQVDSDSPGACDDTSCADNVVVRNMAGPSAGQAKLVVTFMDTNHHVLGTCSADIPPVAHGQTETVSCAVSGPGWADFSAGGGGAYSTTVVVSSPPYDG